MSKRHTTAAPLARSATAREIRLPLGSSFGSGAASLVGGASQLRRGRGCLCSSDNLRALVGTRHRAVQFGELVPDLCLADLCELLADELHAEALTDRLAACHIHSIGDLHSAGLQLRHGSGCLCGDHLRALLGARHGAVQLAELVPDLCLADLCKLLADELHAEALADRLAARHVHAIGNLHAAGAQLRCLCATPQESSNYEGCAHTWAAQCDAQRRCKNCVACLEL